MTESEEEWVDWCNRDPSRYRLHMAVEMYNWDCGYDFLMWLVRNHDLDKSTAVLLILLIEPYDFAGTRNRAEVADKLSDSYIPGFDLMSLIIERWNSGSFRNQKFSLTEHWLTFLNGEVLQFFENAEVEGGLPWELPDDWAELSPGLMMPDWQHLERDDQLALDKCYR